MRYNEIPPEYVQFIEVSEEQFDSLPEDAQNAMYNLAARLYESIVIRFVEEHGEEYRRARDWRAGHDIVRNPAVSPGAENVDYYSELHSNYLVNKLPSHMGIVDYDYYLNDNTMLPNRWSFVKMIVSELEALSRDSFMRVVNICVSYISSVNSVTWLSFSKKDINEIGLDQLLQYLISGEECWDEDFYSGSDNIRNFVGYYALNTAGFRISLESIQGGYGEVEYDYYECANICFDANNNCLIECFKSLDKDLKGIGGTKLSVETIRLILGVGVNEKLTLKHIPLLEQIFDVTVSVYKDERDLYFRYIKGKSLYEYRAKIIRDDPVIIYGNKYCQNKIMYKDDHFDLIVRAYSAKDCHCRYTGTFVGYNTSLSEMEIVKHLSKQYRIEEEKLTDKSEASMKKEISYCFFDYETVFDPRTSFLMPYAWAFVEMNDNFEITNRQVLVGDLSDNIGTKLVRLLKQLAPNENQVKYLIGYNNSRFDNFVLLKDALNENAYISNVRFNGNSITSMSVRGFRVRDLCRILNTSLKKGCESFKCDVIKGELEHDEVQNAYMYGNFKEYLKTNNTKIFEYVLKDCVSLSELFVKTRNEFSCLTDTYIEDHITLAGMSYHIFKSYLPFEHCAIPILNRTQDTFIRKAMYGGRAQIFHSKEIKQTLACIDCVSLYPYVMLNREYPIGNYRYADDYVKNKIGVYNVVIHFQPFPLIIPYRNQDKKKPLDWNYAGELNVVLTSVDIECLLKHGSKISIKGGIYWEESTSDLFHLYFKDIVTMKKLQDMYKKNKDPRYNPALRECCKIIMNALSGKLIQRLFEDVKCLIRNEKELNSFKKNIRQGTEKYISIGSAKIAAGKKNDIKPNMPTIWGILIYSYSRSYMYDNVLSNINPDEIYGTDTDSAFLSYDAYSKLPKNIFGEEFGQFKEEILELVNHNEGEGPYGVFVAPKCYCFYKVNRDSKEEIIKARFKGVNIEKDKVIIDYNLKGKALIEDIKNNKLDAKKLHDIYFEELASEHNVVQKISIDTFRKLANGHTILILCSSLQKKVADFWRNEALSLKQRFLLKEISRSNIEGEYYC